MIEPTTTNRRPTVISTVKTTVPASTNPSSSGVSSARSPAWPPGQRCASGWVMNSSTDMSSSAAATPTDPTVMAIPAARPDGVRAGRVVFGVY